MYQSIRLPVRRSSATRWYRQNRPSAVELREKKGRRRRRKKKDEEKKKEYLAPSSPPPVRPHAVVALARDFSPTQGKRSRR
ncbi:hypothetical protein B296_00043494, partial [Ensete ventricosum]